MRFRSGGQLVRLTVTQSGPARGVVTSTPDRISAEPAAGDALCSALFEAGARVTLRTESDGLRRWTGACEDGTGLGNRLCTITMDRDRGVGIEFGDAAPPQLLELAVAVQGEGRVSGDGGIACRASSAPAECAHGFTPESDLRLLAEPDTGWTFSGWSGDCAQFGTEPAIVTRVSAHLQCFATFSPSLSAQITVTVGSSRREQAASTSRRKRQRGSLRFNRAIRLDVSHRLPPMPTTSA